MVRGRHALAVFCALALAGAGCGDTRAAVSQEEAAPEAPAWTRRGDRIVVPEGSPLRTRLKVETLAARPVRRALEAPAHVEADPSRIARITPPLPGRVVRLSVHFGQEVREGDPLLSLDSPDLVAAQTDWLNARAELAKAERNASRQEDLSANGVTSRADLEQAQTAHVVARAEVERATKRLRLLGVRGGSVGRPLMIRAPIAGRVVELRVAMGEFRSDLSAPLMTIADLSTVWITADVQERDLSRVFAGMEVQAEFSAYPGAPVPGRVLYVGDLLDPETRTLPVRMAFENAEMRLHPGMFARAIFAETARPEIVVPQPAVILRGDKNIVFVEVAPWVFVPREVTLGPPVGDELVVAQPGLRAGERIVVANAVLLQ